MLLILLFLFLLIVQSAYSQSTLPSVNEVDESIRIGLLITVDSSESSLTKQAVDVVDLVLDQVNASGGIREKNVELVVKSVDGNWGAGSKQSVDLIYEDKVSALLAFVDGRSAHLIEQVSVKAQVPFVSTYSPDPTLSKINIPWFFSSMPNADQQSKVLATEIYQKQQLKNIAIITSDDYDYQHLTQSFLREAEAHHATAPSVITFQSGKNDFHQTVLKISTTKSDGVIFFGSSVEWNQLFSEVKSSNIHVPFFLPIMQLDEAPISNSSIPVFTIKPGNWNSEKWKNFQQMFYKKYGYSPGIFASYIYDGASALIQAIKKNGNGHTQIQEGLFNISFEGITGPISFESSGIRKDGMNLVQLK